ncbi:Pyridoxal-5'-phosphate-dependent enzyme, beta subunit [unidentified eubacterium SCB49]|nr:Pyridoxal-5'-phosphate-dependent enzyme, beta subunit [unidentified eubacterium SCB49]
MANEYKQDLLDTVLRVKDQVHQTPILTSTLINTMVGAQLYFKCENFQKMGAFKMRGAVNAISQLSAKQKEVGVVTHSSGNFAQAIALAARNLGIKAYIVMPSNAPKVKMEAVKGYGATIILSEPTNASRQLEADRIVEEKGATFIHPSNNYNVILGQGTAAYELLKKHNDLHSIITPVGGGGLIAGTSIAANYFGNNCKTIGAEPATMDDAKRSLVAGKIQYNTSGTTVADGLRTHLGAINFPIIQKFVEDIFLVEEQQIIDAMKIIWQYLKIVVEPSSAVPLAAILANPAYFRNKKVGVIISGGNVDLANLPF